MAKLNTEEINGILETKGLSCLNIDEYKNLDSILHFQCKNGHTLETSMRAIRNPHFKCPECEGCASLGALKSTVAAKNGFRIVAIDNATEKVGVSVFEDDKLIFQQLYTYTGDTVTRMVKNRDFIEDVVIKQWQPDMVILEDIQYQNNILTFKTLAMLLGSSLISCAKAGIKTELVLSKVWRSNFMINGKTRIEQKKQAIDMVKTMYGLNVTDDEAEAILLGKYAVDKLRVQKVKQLF